jgi:hypothetical protein
MHCAFKMAAEIQDGGFCVVQKTGSRVSLLQIYKKIKICKICKKKKHKFLSRKPPFFQGAPSQE